METTAKVVGKDGIMDAAQELQKSIEELEDTIQRLQERLEPILLVGPSSDKPTLAPGAPGSLLENSIKGSVASVNRNARKLRGIIDGLTL